MEIGFSHIEEKHEPLPVNLVLSRRCRSGRRTAAAAHAAAEVAHARLQAAAGRGVVEEIATVGPGRVTQKDRQRLGRLVPVRRTAGKVR